jgi:hypothetical protein
MDDREQQRQLARNAQKVQNLQVLLLLGMVIGGIVGVILAAYVVLPALGSETAVGIIVALLTIPVCAFIGQRLILSWLAR